MQSQTAIHCDTPFHLLAGACELEDAERLLRYTSLSVREISLRCGFPGESSFCRFFQTRNHMTPIQFRLQNRNRSAAKEDSVASEL